MTSGKCITFGLALLVSSALTGPCLADTYVFSYSFPNGIVSISGSGTLTVGGEDPLSGGFPILSITGTRTVNGTEMQITGLTSYFGNDRFAFLSGPSIPGFRWGEFYG